MSHELLADRPAEILVVDDSLDSFECLSHALSQAGYTVHRVTSSHLKLNAVKEHRVGRVDCHHRALGLRKGTPPDLILLAAKMSGLSSYEICQQLKADPATQDIPVIFLSALDLTFDKVKAFDVGAADYINKPFHPAEVLARVKNQIRIRQQSLQLQAQQAIIQLQSQQLKAAEEKLSALNATA